MYSVGLILRTTIILLDTSLVNCNFVSVTVTCFCLFLTQIFVDQNGKGKERGNVPGLLGSHPPQKYPKKHPPDEEQCIPTPESSPKATQEAEDEAIDLSQSPSQDTQSTIPHLREGKGKEGKKIPPIQFPDYVLHKFFNSMEKQDTVVQKQRICFQQKAEEAWKDRQAFLILIFHI